MQTFDSTAPRGLFPPTHPSDAQLYAGQLEDYELMLSSISEPPTLVSLSNLLPIGPFSPLHQVSEDGLNALWHVLRDRAYIDLCTRLEIKHGDLSVTRKDNAYVYEGWSNAGQRVTVDLTENTKWQMLKPRIERAATLLGDQLNSNRKITLQRMCWFYAMAPWRPRHPQEHPAALAALQEKIARHHLQLEDDFDILALRRRPTDQDRAAFRAHRRGASSPSEVDTQKVHAAIIRAQIIETVNQCLPASSPSPLTYLANDILAAASLEQVRATPTVYLQKILNTNEAQQLGMLLLSMMDWYGGEIGEETAPSIKTKLVVQALQLWLIGATGDNPGEVAGYAWQAPANWGKSYQAIRAEFETHLQTSKRAASEKEAMVMARLFLSRFPSEFQVTDIPANLPYRSSMVWVNFVTGVNLIQLSDPRLLDRMTFQQLVSLPMVMDKEVSAEKRKLIALARLLPTLDWAQTYGFIAQQSPDTYSITDVERALTALDNHNDRLNWAINQLTEKPPERLAIAKKEIERLFGKDAFISDGRKLARKKNMPISVSRDIPYLEGREYDLYSFLDVLASDEVGNHEKWFVTQADGTTVTRQWLRIDENRTIKTDGPWSIQGKTFDGARIVLSPSAKLLNVKASFEKAFALYLEKTTTAYETLIASLIASLPNADRLALAFGEVKIHSLRKETSNVEAAHETPDKILPLRARNGLILQATFAGNTTHYELLPRAGVIRSLGTLAPELLGAALKSERWKVQSNHSSVSVHVWRHKDLPFDWDAHLNGDAPKENARCQAIIERLGVTFGAIAPSPENASGIARTLSSGRVVEISHVIATQLLYVDPKILRDIAYGQTQFDRDSAWMDQTVNFFKALVPFLGSVEDLKSEDKTRWIQGAFGLFSDGISFLLPVGKFASGSMRLMTQASRVTLGARLPSFKLLTMELITSMVGNLNPVDGPVSLLTGLGPVALKLIRAGRSNVMTLLGKAGRYTFMRSVPQIADIGQWRPLAAGDQLARVKGLDDVPVRNLATFGKSDYRLIDPLTCKPYGPRLPTKSGALSPGQSHYRSLHKNDEHILIECPESTRVGEILEVDGRVTLLLDDVPYRLKDDALYRADLIDDVLKSIPCRMRRAPGPGICKTLYVLRDPAPTPDIGSYDESKGWALWFGDSIYTPAAGREPMQVADIARQTSFTATLEFQKGIFGRVMISVPVPGQPLMDNLKAGATIIEAMDGSKHYVSTRLNAGDFYVAERIKGQKPHEPLTFNKAETLPSELSDELKTVYTGALNANNMVRIHGIEAVERALKTMEEIAIPIGGHAHPPETLKWLKVDTSPGEAVLFDHSTRMIASKLPEGATAWTRSREASDALRQRTAEIFDTLFLAPTITVNADSALKIDSTMTKLNSLLSPWKRKHRNIAYAEVTTATGTREVYVSVSGNKQITGFLPLFRHNLGADPVKVGDVSYFNIDANQTFHETALDVTPGSKVLAVPHTIKDIETYRPDMTRQPTSLDSESKLIRVIREKYPDRESIKSVNVATTLAPCDSCSVVMKQFGYDGSQDGLAVTWK